MRLAFQTRHSHGDRSGAIRLSIFPRERAMKRKEEDGSVSSSILPNREKNRNLLHSVKELNFYIVLVKLPDI